MALPCGQKCVIHAAMNREEYRELTRKIVALYEGRVVEYAREMESEKEKDLQAIARIWRLENDGQDPPTFVLANPPYAKASTNGAHPISQKQKIRRIIEGLSGPVDSAKVLKRFGELYIDSDEKQPESSTISKVFREMEKKGEIRKTKEAGFQQPAEYVKS